MFELLFFIYVVFMILLNAVKVNDYFEKQMIVLKKWENRIKRILSFSEEYFGVDSEYFEEKDSEYDVTHGEGEKNILQVIIRRIKKEFPGN